MENVTKYLEECNTIDIAVGTGRRRHNRKDEELPFLKADEIAVIANGVVSKRGPAEEIFPELMSQFDNTCTFR